MLRRALATTVVATGLAVAPLAVPAPTQASPLCSVGGVCGKVTVAGKRPIMVGCNWDPEGDGDDRAAPIHNVDPGESSKKYCGKDTDGVFVPPYYDIWALSPRLEWYRIRSETGWWKIRDWQQLTLKRRLQ